jgi:5'-3' exonuclease
MEKTKNKIIILDWGIFIHRAIFSWRNNKQIPVEYTCLNMIMSSLRKVGVNPSDTILVACDYGRSWRREIEKEYKANRKEFREKQEDIDWKLMYKKMDYLLDNIDNGTDWHILKAYHLEADDWMSVGARYFKDYEVILVTFDADMEQLCAYDNVKVFSPLVKMKGKRGGYKIIDNPYVSLSKKIDKEVADNLINPILNESDYEKRKMIVSLLELPEWVEKTCTERFNDIKPKGQIDIDWIPYERIRNQIENLHYDKTQVVTYEECLEKKNKKKRRKKKSGKRKRRVKRQA